MCTGKKAQKTLQFWAFFERIKILQTFLRSWTHHNENLRTFFNYMQSHLSVVLGTNSLHELGVQKSVKGPPTAKPFPTGNFSIKNEC